MNTPNRRRPDGIDPVARSRSRRRALQAIYAWQLGGAGERDLVAQFAHEQAHEVADLEYFEDLVRGVLRHVAQLDTALVDYLDRKVDEVDPIERAALRIAAYELLHRPDVPYRVVINEAMHGHADRQRPAGDVATDQGDIVLRRERQEAVQERIHE
ncbi:MAG: transcription antitermination factor NusB, partial [Lysobacteraceae bacterium]